MPTNHNIAHLAPTATRRWLWLHALWYLVRWCLSPAPDAARVDIDHQIDVVISRRLLVGIIGLLWQMAMDLQRCGGNPAIIRRGTALRHQLEQAIAYSPSTHYRNLSGSDHL